MNTKRFFLLFGALVFCLSASAAFAAKQADFNNTPLKHDPVVQTTDGTTPAGPSSGGIKNDSMRSKPEASFDKAPGKEDPVVQTTGGRTPKNVGTGIEDNDISKHEAMKSRQ